MLKYPLRSHLATGRVQIWCFEVRRIHRMRLQPSIAHGRMQVGHASHTAACCMQVWHLEVRWLICQGHRVEELIKQCARRAKQAGGVAHMLQIPRLRYLVITSTNQAGLLMLQIPTGRRPRPFSPSVLVPIPEVSRKYARKLLRGHLYVTCQLALHLAHATYLLTYLPAFLHSYLPTYPLAYSPTHLRTYLTTYPLAYSPTHLRTYLPTCYCCPRRCVDALSWRCERTWASCARAD